MDSTNKQSVDSALRNVLHKFYHHISFIADSAHNLPIPLTVVDSATAWFNCTHVYTSVFGAFLNNSVCFCYFFVEPKTAKKIKEN